MKLNTFSICVFTTLALVFTRIKGDSETIREAATTNTAVGSDEFDLELMSNEELEEICTSRGFDVVKEKDSETGEEKVYSHEEYIHAAKQCLQIEAEMEELIEQHPELVKEIEEEAERMRQENKRLEQEISQMIKDNSDDEEVGKLKEAKERLEGEMDGLNRVLDAQENSSAAGDQGSESPTTVVDEDITEEFDEDILDLDADKIENGASDTGGENGNTDAVKETQSPGIPLTIGDLVKEVRAQMKEDFDRVANLILPKKHRGRLVEAMKPIISVFREGYTTTKDMIKRYTSQILGQTKKNEEKSNAVASTS